MRGVIPIVTRMDRPDELLAAAAAGGDAVAFSDLLERHYDRIFRLAFRLTGSAADAEDLTQDVCLALPGKLSGFRGDARFTTWLYRVVVNAATDRQRKSIRYARAAEGWGDVERARQAEADEARDARDWLTRAMGCLPEDLRTTVALILDDLTHAEAAAVLGVSEGTVSWRVSEARKRLRAVKESEA